MSGRLVPRPAVLRAVPLDRHAVVEASAGTGKTFTLERLVVELLVSTDVTLDRVLVVSFTEKATNEIRVRLRATLEDLLSGDGQDADDADGFALDAAVRRKIEHALHAFDRTTIATIHAFCQRVLRDNAFASGRLFEEQQIDGRDAFGRAMRESLRREVAPDPRRARWLEAALREGWSMGRLEELLWSCAQARAELMPPFDMGALDEALAAFPVDSARRPEGAGEMQRWGMAASTAKAVARRLYAVAESVDEARRSGGAPRYVSTAGEIGFDFLLERLPKFMPRGGPTGGLCAAALALARVTPSLAAAVAHTVLPAVRGELARRKREAGQYDFDDMLGLVDQALHGPRAAALASAMRERWRYVLIDEFQDTDETQWSIFRRAFFERESTGGSVLYLLADPKQSIYRFRGADVHTYLRARDEVVAAGGARVALDHNYRATPGLVAAINAIFDPSADRPVFTGGIRYTPVACGRPDRAMVDGAGRPLAPVQVMRLGSPIDLRAMQSLGRWIAAEIRTMTDPARPWRFDGRPLAHSDVFVLTRNAREGRIVGAALRSAGVPHAFYKQDGLFQTDEARDVRTLLLAVEDPEDRARRLSAWLTPFFGLPLSSLERARDLPGSHPLVTRLRGWRALGEAREFDALFESIVVASGIVRREIFFGEGERELTNYLHIFELLFEYGARSHHTLRDVVSALSGLIDKTRLPLDLEGNVQRLESDRRAVQIMTIHKSKGLEAPVVFVVGGFSQPPGDDVHVYHDGARRLAWVGPVGDPAAAERAKAEEREEDQRLMYVALTRAQGRLYVPCATIGKRDGGDAEGGAKALRGPYDVVNRRVAELLRAGDETALAVSDVPVGLESTEADDAAGRSGEPPWRPPPALLAADTDAVMHAELGRARMGAFVTSYTRMKAQDVAARAARFGAVARGAAPEVDADDEARDDRLRGARASGVFLHELLERVPLESFGAAAASRDWALRPEVAAAFDESMAAHGIDPAQRAHAEELVWTAYTTPLVLPGGGRLERIADAARVAREMDFVFPLSGHAALGEAREPRQRGYVRGSIDLAFEHRGLAYFIDWKSDSLASFSPDAVDRHVRAQYEAQARLYSLAIARLLGSRTREEHDARFGGVLYCFLRGLDGRGRGLWSARPTWDELVGWDDALRGAQRGRAAR